MCVRRDEEGGGQRQRVATATRNTSLGPRDLSALARAPLRSPSPTTRRLSVLTIRLNSPRNRIGVQHRPSLRLGQLAADRVALRRRAEDARALAVRLLALFSLRGGRAPLGARERGRGQGQGGLVREGQRGRQFVTAARASVRAGRGRAWWAGKGRKDVRRANTDVELE